MICFRISNHPDSWSCKNNFCQVSNQIIDRKGIESHKFFNSIFKWSMYKKSRTVMFVVSLVKWVFDFSLALLNNTKSCNWINPHFSFRSFLSKWIRCCWFHFAKQWNVKFSFLRCDLLFAKIRFHRSSVSVLFNVLESVSIYREEN